MDDLEKERLLLTQWRQYFITEIIQSVLADMTMIVVSIIGLWYYLHQSFFNNYQMFGLAFFTVCLILTVISFHLSQKSCYYKILELYQDRIDGYDPEKAKNIEELLQVSNIVALGYFFVALFILVVFR